MLASTEKSQNIPRVMNLSAKNYANPYSRMVATTPYFFFFASTTHAHIIKLIPTNRKLY